MQKKERRFLPTLSQVQEAADQLPDPDHYKTDIYESAPEGWKDKRSLTFSKVTFRTREGKKLHRWVYEGKIMVRSKNGNHDFH